ncbi:MAG TPA: hypothetical protein VJT15_17460 [Pyrinomonadaceae bacterium]|nr:hypothetical protein [Pyrinomonadaceae bacterium]
MSYLDSPRIHFRGWFQADVSTINNDVRFFQNDSFVPEYQQLNANGSWNPRGTGIFRILDTSITGGFLDGKSLTSPTDDSAIGLTLQNATDRAPGKLVDLDPQQQMVSEIFGMQMRLADPKAEALFEGDFSPAAFTNLWQRQQTGPATDQQLCAYYQSVLKNVVWSEYLDSPLLNALKAATQDGKLSINFNVFGFGRDPSQPRYTMGHLVGTIGPYYSGEPEQFVFGRQMITYAPNWPVPDTNVNSLQAKLAADRNSLTADFGNTFPIVDSSGAPFSVGRVHLGVLRSNPDTRITAVDRTQVILLGEVPYLSDTWYTETAGVQTFDLTQNPDARLLVQASPLVLLTPVAGQTTFNVLLQESIHGLYVRADNFVYRMNPGETQQVNFYATQFGNPHGSAAINLSATDGFMGGSGGGASITPPPRPAAAIPDINKPADAFMYKDSITTNGMGFAALDLTTSPDGPQNPRGYIEGQLYGVGYQIADLPAGYISNPMNYVSVLAFDKKEVPAKPTWYQDIQPLFTQYGNLYPIMSKFVVDLNNYEAVVHRTAILKLAFSLPIEDANHMPVTRDLGAGARDTILKWLTSPGSDGKPLLGVPPVSPPPTASKVQLTDVEASAEIEAEPLQGAGKTLVIRQYKARQRAKLERESGGKQ